ncbi:MAG: carbohydrate ABC transporter permease [Firmicutes bacterium]|nr:carbohydrate ABC transporter permease [Bacillota bacterium]
MRNVNFRTVLIYLLTILVTAIFVFPLLWLFLTSFKTRVEILAIPPKFIFKPSLGYYSFVLHSPFMTGFKNSIIIAVASSVFSVILGTLTAYGLSRYPIRLSENLLFWMLSLRMLPVIAIIVPMYMIFRALGLLDTHIALILIYSIFNISFTVWLMKGMFDEVPRDLEESGMLDGYSPFEVFSKVSLPLVSAGIATTAVFCLIQTLNEFMLALILTNRVAVTAPVALSGFHAFFGIDWGNITAAATIFLSPVIIFTIFVRKYLIRGLSFGGMK